MASIQLGAATAKRVLFPVVGPEGAVALRVVLAAVILLVIRRPWRKPPTWAEARWIVLYGAVLGLMNLLFYMALRTIPLGVAVALEFTGPLAVAMAGSRRRLDFLWVAVAAGGVLLLLPLGGFSARLDPGGLALALGAGACWAAYIVFGRKAAAGGVGGATAIGMAVAALVVAPVGWATAGAGLFAPAWLLAGLAVAVLSSALPYTLEMVALTRLPQKTFGVLMSLEPAIGTMSGLMLLGERPTLVQSAAMLAIMAASAGSAMTARADPSALRQDPPPPS